MERFAPREAPKFRPANGTPPLQIKIVIYKDNFGTEREGKLYY